VTAQQSSSSNPSSSSSSILHPREEQQQQPGSSPSSSSSSSLKDQLPVSPKAEAQLTLQQYQEIYDRLIKIFQERPRDDWKKLIVFSKQWSQHKQGVLDR
jgi:hypothetical protein